MKKASRVKKVRQAAPATMPEPPQQPPRQPSAEESELTRQIIEHDTADRREAARAYLDSEREVSRMGLDITKIQKSPKPPTQQPDPP